MPKIDSMVETVAYTTNVAGKLSNAINGIEKLGTVAALAAKPMITYESKVNYRPAAQQWTV